MSYGVGSRRGSDMALLWLWHRLAATAPIGPLAWEPSYATGVAIKRQKTKKKKKKKTECGGKFLFQYVESKELGFGSYSIPQTVSASCPLVSHLSIPLFLRQREQYLIFNCALV